MSHPILQSPTRRMIATVLMVTLVVGCGGGGNDGPASPPSGVTGSLTVTVAGLPGDVTPSVVVTGPAGFSQTLSATRILTGLAAGTYTITPGRIADRSVGYDAAAVTSAVTAGGTASATATYSVRILARSTTNRTDESSAARIKLIYAVPSDGTDRGLDTNGTIHRIISSGQRWLATQMGGRAFRYDVSDGGLDITFIRLPRTDATYHAYNAFVRDSIEKDLKAIGFNQANVGLLVYYDGRHVDRCGSSAQSPQVPGNTAAVYLNGNPTASNGCRVQPFAASPTAAPGYIDFVAVHELFHLTGHVSASAPNHALSGHVGNDPTDLMYAGSLAWRPAVVDVTKTNYYNATGLPGGISNIATSSYIVQP